MNKLTVDLLINSMSSISNTRDKLGPSVQFTTVFKTLEERILVRTPLMIQFLESTARRYHTDGGYMLDVGCGRGNDAALLITKGYKLVSCDLSEDMIKMSEECREAFIAGRYEEFKNWEIFQGDMLTLHTEIFARDQTPQQYDCVLCLASLWLVLSIEDIKKALANFEKLLRPGGALVIDHRNFLPMVTRGKANKNGHNPYSVEEFNGLKDIIPYAVYGPGPERQPLAVFMDYKKTDGSSVYLTSLYLTPELIISLVKSTFGEDCKIQILHDLKNQSECSLEDACFVTYVVEKPSV